MPSVYTALMFADSECTQPVIAAYWSCAEPDLRYARRYDDGDGCDKTVETYVAVEGEVAEDMPVFTTGPGGCAAAGTAQAIAAEPLADAALVRATPIERSRAGGMSMRILHADDGAVWPEALVDEGLGEPCRPDPESARCIPSSAATFTESSVLLDALCEQRVVAVDACDGETLRGRETECAPWSFYAYGESVETDALGQLGEGAVCEPVEVGGETHVTVGDIIPYEAFPAVEFVTVGDGTVQERRVIDGVGDSLMTGASVNWLYDSSIEALCQPMLVTDGGVRCIPQAARVSLPLFADDQCTEPVVRVGGDPCDAAASPVSYAVELESCGVVSSVFALGEAYEAGEVYFQAGTCRLAPPTLAQGPFARIGEELPLETFVELTYTVFGPEGTEE